MNAQSKAKAASPADTSDSPSREVPEKMAVRTYYTPGAADAVARAWREPPALTLDEHGVIMNCSERGEEFFGYTRSELARQHVSTVLPQLSGLALLKDGQPHAYLNFLCRIGHAFEVTPRNGVGFVCGLSLVCLTGTGHTLLKLIVQS